MAKITKNNGVSDRRAVSPVENNPVQDEETPVSPNPQKENEGGETPVSPDPQNENEGGDGENEGGEDEDEDEEPYANLSKGQLAALCKARGLASTYGNMDDLRARLIEYDNTLKVD